MSDVVMSTFTIYFRPASHPHAVYAVQRFDLFRGSRYPLPGAIATADTLQQARDLLPPGVAVCIIRSADDDPTIVETWM